MKGKHILLSAALLACLAFSCARVETPTGASVPDKGWLFLEKGPYTLTTKVNAAPGPADIVLVKDLSLMAAEPEVVRLLGELEAHCDRFTFLGCYDEH